jgi:hypothetical protein
VPALSAADRDRPTRVDDAVGDPDPGAAARNAAPRPVAPTLAEIAASRVPRRTVATFPMGTVSLGQIVRIRDTAIEVTFAKQTSCRMWFGNLGAAARFRATPGYRQYPYVDATWNLGGDSLFRQLAPTAATHRSHCSRYHERDQFGNENDLFFFSTDADRDRFFTDLFSSGAAWHRRYPHACAVDVGLRESVDTRHAWRPHDRAVAL